MKQKKLRILAMVAHPDDVELGCAGTLAKCKERGDEIFIAITCKGDTASSNMSPDELVKTRSLEAHKSAALLGAELMELGMSDYGVEINSATKSLFTDAIRKANPDAVITHYHDDYFSDHINTFHIVLDCTLAATVANVRTTRPAIKEIPYIYMMEPFGGFGFNPTVYVDITDVYEKKVKMLECHKSQLDWMACQGGMDFKEYMETVARFRGYQCGVKYAEGFILHPSWGHIPPKAILP